MAFEFINHYAKMILNSFHNHAHFSDIILNGANFNDFDYTTLNFGHKERRS